MILVLINSIDLQRIIKQGNLLFYINLDILFIGDELKQWKISA